MHKVNGSDYISVLKRKTIYASVKNNAVQSQTANPVKLNGKTYNKDLALLMPNPCTITDCSGGIITSASSYDILLNFQEGKRVYKSTCPNNASSSLCSPCALLT
jgi:hypothetical protein